ncbi:MAG: UDP-3-O-acyl-N-acetylglucosamine deacetylase [Aquificae bacterium]|nr:UDP-3-O-acyl-N-acetylglucosamine deacetylase [Aquificota bacterium]
MLLRGKTLRNSITLTGVGIHNGIRNKIKIHPSEERGIYFLIKGVKIPALHKYVVNTCYSTDLGRENQIVRTVEHIMAAFYLLKIDSAVVEIVEGNEIPILGGGAKEFIEAFLSVGTVELEHYQKIFRLAEHKRYQPNGNFVEALPFEKEVFIYEGIFRYLGRQLAVYEGGLESKLIGARTFCFEEDIPNLRKMNLGKGGYHVNTLVINPSGEYLRYREEPTYHKLLDLIGDMALLGGRLQMIIYSFRGGHSTNHGLRQLIKNLLIEVKANKFPALV